MGKTTQFFFAIIRALIGIALLLYLGLSGAIDWSALGNLIDNLAYSFATLILLLAIIFLISWRFYLLLKAVKLYLPFLVTTKVTLIGAFFNTFLPGTTGGDIARIFYTKQAKQGQLTEVATVVVLDRILGLFALLTLFVFLTPFFLDLLANVPILKFALIIILAIIIAIPLCLVLVSRLKVRNRILGKHLARIHKVLIYYRRNTRTVLHAIGISVAAHIIQITAILLLIKTTSAAGISSSMGFIIPLGFILNALPITPGGLGVGEFAFDNLFSVAGLSGGVEALIAWRILTTLIDLSGLVFFIEARRTHMRAVAKSSLEQNTEFS